MNVIKSEGKGKGKRGRRNITFTMLEGEAKSAGKKEGLWMGMGRAKNTIFKK